KQYWPENIDVKEDRKQIQEWLNIISDEKDLEKASEIITGVLPGPSSRKLWLFILNALERLMRSQSSSNISETTVITRYAVPVLKVFLNKSQQNVVLDSPNIIAKVVRHRKQANDEKQGKRPDIRLSVVDGDGDVLIEVGHEVKSSKNDKNGALVARDLVRIGLFLKDQLDAAEDLYCVTTSLPVGMMIVGNEASFYLMTKCGNFYIMAHMATVVIPDSIEILSKLACDFKTWRQFEKAAVDGYQPPLEAIRSGKSGTPKPHFPTTTSPELRLIKNSY
ncbi:hypothetical protein BGX27_001377, partial [Mortierella sp. AM989]